MPVVWNASWTGPWKKKKTAQMLELAKLAHQEGRFTEARRLLERIAQDRPNTPASKEAASLILQVMAAARQQKDTAVVKYRAPAAPVRAAKPPRRDAAGVSSVPDAGGRESDAAAKKEQSEQALELAKTAHQEGRFDEARRHLERLAQNHPNTPAAKEGSKLILEVMAATRQQKDTAVVKYRAPAAPVRAAPPPRRDTAGSSSVQAARGRERDAAAEEEQSNRALEHARTAHREGRFDEARRQLERLAQDHPGTPAAKEAANLILEVMAAARQQKEPAVVKYSAPAAPVRAATPPSRDTAGASSVGDAGGRERDAAADEEQSNRALELARTAHREGRFDEARRQLERLAQDHPRTPAAKEAGKLILQVMAAARQQKESTVVKYREPAAPVRSTPPRPRESAGTSTVRDAGGRERDAAAEEEQSNRALELARTAHREGRFDEARRLLERLAQDHPRTPAAKEASKLILEVMAAARQQKKPAVVKYREPAAPVRPTPPRPREAAGTLTVRKAGARERDAAAEEEQKLTKYRDPAPTSRTPPPPQQEVAKTSERVPITDPPKTPPAAAVLTPDPKARDAVARYAEQLRRQKTDHGFSSQPEARAKE
jgi:tetratricopeptide (TPR) repeat protein